MFLMEGGYLHFRLFEKPIDEWSKKMTDVPSVSVFIPAHNEALVIEHFTGYVSFVLSKR